MCLLLLHIILAAAVQAEVSVLWHRLFRLQASLTSRGELIQVHQVEVTVVMAGLELTPSPQLMPRS